MKEITKYFKNNDDDIFKIYGLINNDGIQLKLNKPLSKYKNQIMKKEQYYNSIKKEEIEYNLITLELQLVEGPGG